MKRALELLIIALLFSIALPVNAQQVSGAATVVRNANLRGGPGTTFAVVDGVSQGESVRIVGCNAACDWYELADGTWIAAFLVEMTTTSAPADAAPITVVGWNTELNDAAIDTITERIAAFQDVDLWGLSEINRTDYQGLLEQAAAVGEAADYGSVLGESGGGDRLLALYDATRFTLINSWEEEPINTTGNTRAALVLHLRETTSAQEFLFMVNHLYRSRDEERHKQAELLNRWAARQTLPVLAVGDYNFDWAIAGSGHDRGYDLLTANNHFAWVRPDTLVTTQCSGWPCQYNSVLDFVFTAGAAQSWRAEVEIVVVPGDFPDDNTTSDHRPVLARFWPDQQTISTPTQPARPTATSAPTSPTANRNANLRSGPGTNYAVAGNSQPGQALRIIGRNAAGDWYQLDNGTWIAAILVNGAPAGLNVVEAPPLPTSVPPTTTPVPASPTATPVPAQPIAPPQQATNCDPSYPTVCIPPRPPDLDCGEIPYRRFQVIGSDPHGFDGDNDGIGCER